MVNENEKQNASTPANSNMWWIGMIIFLIVIGVLVIYSLISFPQLGEFVSDLEPMGLISNFGGSIANNVFSL